MQILGQTIHKDGIGHCNQVHKTSASCGGKKYDYSCHSTRSKEIISNSGRGLFLSADPLTPRGPGLFLSADSLFPR